MAVSSAVALKLMVALALGTAILASARARAPRRPVPRSDLHWLVVASLALYAVGGVASLTRHAVLAVLLCASGIAACTLAAWLSRGIDPGGPPDDSEPVDEHPPPEPDEVPGFDWAAFEQGFRAYSRRRERLPAGTR